MRILLLGKSGLVGNAVFRVFSGRHELICPPHELCDITDAQQLRRAVEREKPDAVINAAGYTAVDRAEQDSVAAFQLNAEVIENLANILKGRNIPLVHFSSDYVFDGSKTLGYREDDPRNPISVYGASKAAGEAVLIASGIPFYLIRTSWLYGEGGSHFVEKILTLSRERKNLAVVNDQTGCPTYSQDLAKAVLALLEGNVCGIYHVTNSGSCTRFEFAEEIFQQLGWPQRIAEIASSELKNAAPRPRCSILINTKLPALRHWKEALSNYLSQKVLVLTPQ